MNERTKKPIIHVKGDEKTENLSRSMVERSTRTAIPTSWNGTLLLFCLHFAYQGIVCKGEKCIRCSQGTTGLNTMTWVHTIESPPEKIQTLTLSSSEVDCLHSVLINHNWKTTAFYRDDGNLSIIISAEVSGSDSAFTLHSLWFNLPGSAITFLQYVRFRFGHDNHSC